MSSNDPFELDHHDLERRDESVIKPENAQLEHDVQILTEFNRLIQPILRAIATESVEKFNEILMVFERNKIIIGGDSECFHILNSDDSVTDCNPDPSFWIEEVKPIPDAVIEELRQTRHNLISALTGRLAIPPSAFTTGEPTEYSCQDGACGVCDYCRSRQ